MDNRKLGMIAAGVGALMILIAAVTHTWWSKSEGSRSIAIGMMSGQLCRKGDCESHSLSERARDSEKGFATTGTIAFVFSMLAVLGLAAAAGAAAAGKNLGGANLGVAGVSALTAVLGLAFFLQAPSDLTKHVDMGAGMPLHLLGSLAGAAGAFFLSKGGDVMAAFPGVAPTVAQGMPAVPQAYQVAAGPRAEVPATVAAPSPFTNVPDPTVQTPCAKCGAIVRYIPEYKRNWCDRCQAYV